MLVGGFSSNTFLQLIDLSHNSIGDRGAKALAKLLASSKCVLEELDISDNMVGEEGGVVLGHALLKNSSLRRLRMSLNNVGDQGMSRSRLVESTLCIFQGM